MKWTTVGTERMGDAYGPIYVYVTGYKGRRIISRRKRGTKTVTEYAVLGADQVFTRLKDAKACANAL